MEYTKTFNELKSVFSTNKKEIDIPNSDLKIYNIGFKSDYPLYDFINKNDISIPENREFSYPVITPKNRDSKKVILLLHGLNERSWLKYYIWALYLAENTESYVILFPISFHINRSPALWSDPRAMVNFMKVRNSGLGEVNMSSFANIALSNRLTEDPLRFFNSGYQTASDIVKLFRTIRNGEHSIIPRSSTPNIFAYSIGAFLAEIILMGNPENLFSESKLFIFCGGSVFSNMHGASKLIMDSLAFNRVFNFYLNDFEKTIRGRSPLVELLFSSSLGMAFRSMIDLERFKGFRENILMKLRDQIHSITLLRDTVIPARGVLATLKCIKKNDIVKIWDFPYSYSHENPFPVFNNLLSEKVDTSFEKVFSEAKYFFC